MVYSIAQTMSALVASESSGLRTGVAKGRVLITRVRSPSHASLIGLVRCEQTSNLVIEQRHHYGHSKAWLRCRCALPYANYSFGNTLPLARYGACLPQRMERRTG